MTEHFLRLVVDHTADAAYVGLSDEPVARTVSVSEGVQVDLDEHNVVVGIEVLTLGADLPFAALVSEYHVHSDVVNALRSIRPSVSGFLTMTIAQDGTATPAALQQLVGV